MSNFKIIASDLDGTLLNERGEASGENLLAIRALARHGAYFVPASGRFLAEIPSVLKNEESIRYYIHSSGAGLYDKKTGKNTSFGFPAELSSRILREIYKFDCHITVRREGRMLTDANEMTDAFMSKYRVFPAHVELLRECGEGIEGLREKMLLANDIDMISLFFADDDVLNKARETLLGIEGVNVASACDYNIELTYEKAGKGNALIALADLLGVQVSETVAVGDSENDIPMIKAAGLGLAVANAVEKVKFCADDVICKNDENAVRFILEKYF